MIMKLKDLKEKQKRKLFVAIGLVVAIFTSYLAFSLASMYNDRSTENSYWQTYLEPSKDYEKAVEERGQHATKVTVGTYVENLKEINIKASSFRVSYEIWFKWEGDPKLDMMNHYRIYKGTINKQEVIKDYHNGTTNYQKVRVDATITKSFWTKRFPLESHQLRMYIESNYPVEKVTFVGDVERSGTNPNLSITGYDLTRSSNAVTGYTIKSTGDPEITNDITSSEYMSAIEINRSGPGLYVKCFIALLGTLTWIMITLFLCSYHHVDPLGMIPAALFGTVSNIMVGANLLPDALDLGLLEFVNIYGIMCILAGAIIVINVNRIRNAHEDKAFAGYFGRRLFYLMMFFIIIGNILFPLVSYMF